ncbi:uncharacterized protein LOC126737768 isoform X2 [Anthonomus grandis grandis]|uniref:uncharacterized protein LOC126737768 isoform X2 n=1 Tax=Anthonomus grandis grandis TaxID=2921223 RepID=UPI0021665F07|nr:uncharacterized protein LOC126737768 isoform X2 [Anthonomus grandis grandis]
MDFDVLEDLIAGLTSNRLIKDLMKPQPVSSEGEVREIIETIANSSAMKLDPVSMNKLWDLITMVFKWQLTISSAIIETTQRHLYELESYVASEGTQLQLHRVQNIMENFNKILTGDEKRAVHEDLVGWCQKFNVRVSLLLRMGLQNDDGNFNINDLDPVAEKMLQNIGENIYHVTQNGRILENQNEHKASEDFLEVKNANELKFFVHEMLGERKLSTGSNEGNPNMLRLCSLTESKLNNNPMDDRFDSIDVNVNDNDNLQSLMTDMNIRDETECNSFKDDLLNMIDAGQNEMV